MPRVSIILPVYNKEEYLDNTLSLLITQSFQDWELIIIDDGSTDNSSKIARKYAFGDDRIKVISQENKGVSAARNQGINNASGEWIWFVDADDMPNKEFLRNIFLYNLPNDIDIIAGNYERLEKDGSIQKVAIEEKGYISSEQFPDIFMKYQYVTGYWGYLWNKLINRQRLMRCSIRFQEGVTLAEDLQFMVALYRQDVKLICVSYFAMRYTVDSNNSSTRKKIDYLSQLEIQLEIKEWIIDCEKRVERIGFFEKIISSYAAFVIFYGYEDDISCIELSKTLLNNPHVVSQLSTKDIEHTMLPIVWCLKKKKVFIMNVYLYLRKILKNICKMLKRD